MATDLKRIRMACKSIKTEVDYLKGWECPPGQMAEALSDMRGQIDTLALLIYQLTLKMEGS